MEERHIVVSGFGDILEGCSVSNMMLLVGQRINGNALKLAHCLSRCLLVDHMP